MQDPDLEAKFEQTIYKITGGNTTLGIEELLPEQARHEGERAGEARGKKEGEAWMKEKQELLFVQALLQETGFSKKKIASLVDVPVDFVQKVRAKLRKS